MYETKITSLITPIVLLASSCSNNDNIQTGPVSTAGDFSGQFRLVHTSSRTGVRDTMKANIDLNLNLTTGFKLTSDTATVIAGSYGGYAIASTYISFNHVTYPKTGVPVKTHLNDTYNYTYDGSALQMVFNSAFDTLSYQYDLMKTN